MRGGLGHASRATARTEAAAFATERHELLVPAGLALDAQESVFEAPAFEVRLELFLDEVRQRDCLGFEVLQKPRIVLFDEGIEGGVLRAVAFVRDRVTWEGECGAGGHRSSTNMGAAFTMRFGSGRVIENSVPSGVGRCLADHAQVARAAAGVVSRCVAPVWSRSRSAWTFPSTLPRCRSGRSPRARRPRLATGLRGSAR